MSSTAKTPGHSAAFIRKQKARLLDLKDQLLDAMSEAQRNSMRVRTEGSESTAGGVHSGDAGSDSYDREFALSILSKEQDALYEIDEALSRIEHGKYGICEISGKLIKKERLEAIPFARLTVEEQTEWEKEHGRRRFDPKASFGYTDGKVDEKSSRVFLDSQRD